MAGRSRGEWVRAWKPAVPGISEVFHARFIDHRYPPHMHDDWTVFTVDGGAIRYDLDARDRGVGRNIVTLLPPHVVHDGRAATGAGFRKRVLYIGTDVIPAGLIGRAVDDPDIRDWALLSMIGRLHELLAQPDDLLAAEWVLGEVGERIRLHLDHRLEAQRELHQPRCLARGLRDLLENRLFEKVTLADAATRLEATVPHLVRAFRETYGVPPHQYLIARRIESARKRLLDGYPVARVAAEVGFHDQAHFTRHFKRHIGETPGRFSVSAV